MWAIVRHVRREGGDLEDVLDALRILGPILEEVVGEIMDASQGQGASVKRREDIHKMADANKAFAHYRW